MRVDIRAWMVSFDTKVAQIKAEFMRKDESLKGIQSALEDQFRHFQKEIEKT